jgi:hypothetical protein
MGMNVMGEEHPEAAETILQWQCLCLELDPIPGPAASLDLQSLYTNLIPSDGRLPLESNS